MVQPATVSADYTKDIFPDSLSAESHLRRAKLQLWPRTGAPCVCLPHPIKNEMKYPHGSFLDLDTFPIWTIHPLCLRQFLEVRGLHLRQKESWRTLVRLLKRSLRQKLQPMTLEVGILYSYTTHTLITSHTHTMHNRNGTTIVSDHSIIRPRRSKSLPTAPNTMRIRQCSSSSA